MNVLPNFIIPGASKSGTSSVYHYLKQHPDIFLSEIQKEGRFFSQMQGNYSGPGDHIIDGTIKRDLKSYQTLFDGFCNEKAVGDISPEYLYFYKNSIPLIKKTLGEEVRIIIILRSPIERAYSAYMHFKRDQREKLSFEEALQKEDERKKDNWIWTWQYKKSGLYFDQVNAFMKNFRNTKIFLLEDLGNDPQNMLNEICRFIGVSSDFQFDTSYKYNVSGDPKSQILYKLETSRKLIKYVKKLIPKKIVKTIKHKLTGEKQMIKSEMNPATREQLVGFFKSDILKLQGLIGRDLSEWLK